LEFGGGMKNGDVNLDDKTWMVIIGTICGLPSVDIFYMMFQLLKAISW
jgi:hypothetical protein